MIPPSVLRVVGAALLLGVSPAAADDFDVLVADFWRWRMVAAPLAFNNNDIQRLERPPGWLPDWSLAAVTARRKAIAGFEARLNRIDAVTWPVPRQVDYRLLRLGLARARFEIDTLRAWERNPSHYLDHSIGLVREALLPPPPLGPERSAEVVRRIVHVPLALEQGKDNLRDARAPYAELALAQLKDMRARWGAVVSELKPALDARSAAALDAPAERALLAFETFEAWLKERAPGMPKTVHLGRAAYLSYLRDIALLPYSPEELLAMGRQHADEHGALVALEQAFHPAVTAPAPEADGVALGSRAVRDERALRAHLEARRLLTVPADVPHYRLLPIPGYLLPIEVWSMNDLAAPERAAQGSVFYVFPRTGSGPEYYADPRGNIAHTFVGHDLQQRLSWRNDSVVRRRYYDASPSEGLAAYATMMLLRSGAFDDSPYMRQAALREAERLPRSLGWDFRYLWLGEGSFDEWKKEFPLLTLPRNAGYLDPGNMTGGTWGVSRSCASWRRRGASRARSSTSLPSTITCGGTGTCRYRSCAGSISGYAIRWRPSTAPRRHRDPSLDLAGGQDYKASKRFGCK